MHLTCAWQVCLWRKLAVTGNPPVPMRLVRPSESERAMGKGEDACGTGTTGTGPLVVAGDKKCSQYLTVAPGERTAGARFVRSRESG